MPSDFFLELDGIKGESKDSEHPGAIEIDSFSWGAANNGSAGAGSGAGAGKVEFQDIHLTSHVNKASPELAQACATGLHFKKAQLFVRKQGGKQQDYYIVTLEDLLVSSYQSGGSEGANALPADQFSLNFAKIRFEYKLQRDDGSLHAPVTAGWNLKENRKQ